MSHPRGEGSRTSSRLRPVANAYLPPLLSDASHCRRRFAPLTTGGGPPMADAKTIEAIKKAVESAPERKFPETVEVAINLKDVDLSVPKNRLDEEGVLPKGRGKPIKVCIFASGQLAFKAKDAADLIVTPDQIEDLAGNKR